MSARLGMETSCYIKRLFRPERSCGRDLVTYGSERLGEEHGPDGGDTAAARRPRLPTALKDKRVMTRLMCEICGSATQEVGFKTGAFRREAYYLRRCQTCRFTFVANPWTSYSDIYSQDYYSGKGADPLVDYQFELEHPGETIRQHEWRGIVDAVGSLIAVGPATKWLDYGCGNGGLVRYCRSVGMAGAVGFEDGAIREAAIRRGIPFLDEAELASRQGTFDVVTAIEVLEHVERPLDFLRRVRSLLKPGGLFFYTTGNAAPHAKRILQWQYVVPEIHISFYEPETLRRALVESGFRPEFRGYIPGFTEILRFKILKNLRVRRRKAWHNLAPWFVLARIANAKHQVTGFPVAWAE